MTPTYAGKVVAFTGIRDLHPDSILTVRDRVVEIVGDAAEVRFGGALGSDTVALLTAVYYPPAGRPRPRMVVFVPGYIYQQPKEAYEAIRRSVSVGAEFHEMCLDVSDKRSYWARNALLIRTADVVVGFTDGGTSGGTAGTLKMAEQAGKHVERVRILRG